MVLLVVFGIVEGYGLGSLVVVTYVAGINCHETVITGSAVGRRADEAGHEHSAAFVHLDVTLEGAGDVARVDIIALVAGHRHGVDTGECSRCGVECRLYEDLLGRSAIEHPDGAVGILEEEVFGVQREFLLVVHHELYITTCEIVTKQCQRCFAVFHYLFYVEAEAAFNHGEFMVVAIEVGHHYGAIVLLDNIELNRTINQITGLAHHLAVQLPMTLEVSQCQTSRLEAAATHAFGRDGITIAALKLHAVSCQILAGGPRRCRVL